MAHLLSSSIVGDGVLAAHHSLRISLGRLLQILQGRSLNSTHQIQELVPILIVHIF